MRCGSLFASRVHCDDHMSSTPITAIQTLSNRRHVPRQRLPNIRVPAPAVIFAQMSSRCALRRAWGHIYRGWYRAGFRRTRNFRFPQDKDESCPSNILQPIFTVRPTVLDWFSLEKHGYTKVVRQFFMACNTQSILIQIQSNYWYLLIPVSARDSMSPVWLWDPFWYIIASTIWNILGTFLNSH